MTSNAASVALSGVSVRPELAVRGASLRFELAGQEAEPELRAFGCGADMPGMIRFAFERAPDYFGALRVEGRESEVLVCRNAQTGKVMATGHRSLKPVFVNGQSATVSYLSGLRVAEGARRGTVLARGYRFLRELQAQRPAPFSLTTIMEDNRPAQAVLTSGRGGLPQYHDWGRFCCMAIGLGAGRAGAEHSAQFCLRWATQADAPALLAFLRVQGRLHQFFPDYQPADFGAPGGLLAHLKWEDVLLAFRGNELLGVVAAWDQRAFRQWRITGYAAWLRLLRCPLNLLARWRQMPVLPKPGSALSYFVLSLVCIRDNDPAVFVALLEKLKREKRQQYDFFLAGMHEREPLLPQLKAQPHLDLPSRLYVVAWPEEQAAVQALDRQLVPYLELGAL